MSDAGRTTLLVSMFTVALVAFVFNLLAFREARRYGGGSVLALVCGAGAVLINGALMAAYA